MHPSGRTDRQARERELRALAERQFGLLRREDLCAAGLTADAIKGRLDTCRLTRVQGGVYAFGHAALRDEGRWLAALWTCGGDAALSHLTAAAYFGWPLPGDRWDRSTARKRHAEHPVHVSVTGSRRSRDGLIVHRVRRLDRVDVFRPHPLCVTTMPRTLVDLADVLTWPQYRAVADALRRLNVPAIRAAQHRSPNRPGAPLVTRLVAADDAHTKSEFERRFLRFVDTHIVARPDALNEWVAGQKADCVYHERRLVVELDGRAHHQRRGQMRADRHRDIAYQAAGYRIMRLVWDDLHPTEAPATVTRLRKLLG